jgi:hypothetical protein
MSVDMRYYLDKVLAKHDNLQLMVGPGMKEGFRVKETSPVVLDQRTAPT